MNPEELQFFEDNKERIFDLIRAVDQHESIRGIVGAGQVENSPHLIPDYTRTHDIMSRVSRYLQDAHEPHTINFGPQDDHVDLPARLSLDMAIKMSC